MTSRIDARAALLCLALVSGCGRALVGGQTAGDAGPSEDGPITIGVIWFSGEVEALNWMTLAVEQFNSLGGYQGRTVRMAVRTTEPRQAFSVEAMRELVNDEGAIMIVGHPAGFAGLANAQLGEEIGVPVINFASGLPQFVDLAPAGERYSFGLGMSSLNIVAAAVDILDTNVQCTEVFYIGDFLEGAEFSEIELLRSGLNERGVPLVRTETILPNQEDFTSFYAGYTAENPPPDCVLFNLDWNLAGIIFGGWRDSGAPLPEEIIMTTIPWSPFSISAVTDPEYWTGTTCVTTGFPYDAMQRSFYDMVLPAYEARWGARPTESLFGSRIGYDVMTVALLGLLQADRATTDEIRRTIAPSTRTDMLGASEGTVFPGQFETAFSFSEMGFGLDMVGLWDDWNIGDDGRHHGPVYMHQIVDLSARTTERLRVIPDPGY